MFSNYQWKKIAGTVRTTLYFLYAFHKQTFFHQDNERMKEIKGHWEDKQYSRAGQGKVLYANDVDV